MHVFEHPLKIKKAHILIVTWAVVTINISLSLTSTVLLIIETSNPPRALSLEGDSTDLIVLKSGNLASSRAFGEAAKLNQTSNDLNSPETSLNLELQGIFIAEEAQRSSVIIGEDKKKVSYFSSRRYIWQGERS